MFYAKERETKVEGEILSCPHCGESLAWTEVGAPETLTLYVLPESSNVWVFPVTGSQQHGTQKSRRKERRAQEFELRAAGTSKADAKAASKELRNWESESRRQTAFNPCTGETVSLSAKHHKVQTVEATGVFNCDECDGLVKIEVSNN